MPASARKRHRRRNGDPEEGRTRVAEAARLIDRPSWGEMDPIETVKAKFEDQVLSVGSHAGQAWVDVKRDRIVDILKTIRDECGYDMLTDLTAVDYLNQGTPERFAVVYNLYSMKENVRTRVKAWVPETDPTLDSVSAM